MDAPDALLNRHRIPRQVEVDERVAALSDTRASNHELTPFLKFGLCGIALQCQRLFAEIKKTNLESVAPQYDVRLVQQTGDHM